MLYVLCYVVFDGSIPLTDPFAVTGFETEESPPVVEPDKFADEDKPLNVFITTGWHPSCESEATDRFESSFIGVTFLIRI